MSERRSMFQRIIGGSKKGKGREGTRNRKERVEEAQKSLDEGEGSERRSSTSELEFFEESEYQISQKGRGKYRSSQEGREGLRSTSESQVMPRIRSSTPVSIHKSPRIAPWEPEEYTGI